MMGNIIDEPTPKETIYYRVEIVQKNEFYIHAGSPEEAMRIASEDYVWGDEQTAPNTYLVCVSAAWSSLEEEDR